MGRKVNKFYEEEFVNSVNQTIKPGDRIVAVTTGYSHSVDVYECTFDGVYKNSNDKVVGTRVTRTVSLRRQIFNESGEHEEKKYNTVFKDGRYAGYEYIPTGRRYDWEEYTKEKKSALQLNRIFKLA